MEIIKRGTPPGERQWRGKCHQCGSEALAKQSELTGKIQEDTREGTSYCWQTCPVCRHGGLCQGMLFQPVRT